MQSVDKSKENGIGLAELNLLKLLRKVIKMEAELEMVEQNAEYLNSVYKEISEKLGENVAIEIYKMFKGQQICFPVRFFNPSRIHQVIVEEYNGTNVRALATKYNYSEKTIRRIVRKNLEEYIPNR